MQSKDFDGIWSAYSLLDYFSTENIEIVSGGNRDAFLHSSRDVPNTFEPRSSGNLKIPMGILSAFLLDSFSTENIEIESGGNAFEVHSGHCIVIQTFPLHSSRIRAAI